MTRKCEFVCNVCNKRDGDTTLIGIRSESLVKDKDNTEIFSVLPISDTSMHICLGCVDKIVELKQQLGS